MNIKLNREFTLDVGDVEDHTWSGYLALKNSGRAWPDLLKEPVSVVLGEAGVGKTVEFQNQVSVLRGTGVFALFVPLNAIIDVNDWMLTPSDSELLSNWAMSGTPGYFFLDAIDESRLSNPIAFRKALSVVYLKLKGQLKLTHFVLSSRHSDWAFDSVKDAIHEYLTRPTCIARLPPAPPESSTDIAVDADCSRVSPVLLKPLSKDDRENLALHFGVRHAADFWTKVVGGDYLEMAVRPRDLKWLVGYWNAKGDLGTYLELMREHVRNRLGENNESYINAKIVLAPSVMQEGVEQLAVAAELSGKVFFSLFAEHKANELLAQDVLLEWEPHDVAYLLDSAVFDLSTFDRVQFNHRTIREFLAACWVMRKLGAGVPFERLCSLFYLNSFGKELLIPSRRYALCWLCAMDPNFRQWVASKFPEVYVFDGDPTAWDAPTAEQAFSGYIRLIANGRRKDWMNSASELRRAVVPLRAGFFVGLLRQYIDDDTACGTLLQYALHGEVQGCEDSLQRIFETAPHESYRYRMTVAVIGKLGDTGLKGTLKTALIGATFSNNNRLIADAISSLGIAEFSVEELVQIFQQTAPEKNSYSELARELNSLIEDLTDVHVVRLVLQAILEVLPALSTEERFGSGIDEQTTPLAWLYEVLAECFTHFLVLLPVDSPADDICIAAAKQIELVQHTHYVNGEKFARIQELMQGHPSLRWQLIDAIVVADAGKNNYRLGFGSIVTLNHNDLEEVTRRANESSDSPEYREMWFGVAVSVIYGNLRKRRRREALSALVVGVEAEARRIFIEKGVAQLAKGACSQRTFANDSRIGNRQRQAADDEEIVSMMEDLKAVASGDPQWVIKMVHHVLRKMRGAFFDKLDFAEVEKKFNKPIAEALYRGLAIFLQNFEVPDPARYTDGSVPWTVLVAATSAQAQGERGEWNGRSAPIAKLSRLDVWFPNGPSDLFKTLHLGREKEVVESLSEWVLAEARAKEVGKNVHSVIKFSMRLSAAIKIPLLQKLKTLPDEECVQHPTHRIVIFDDMVECGVLDIAEQVAIAKTVVENSLHEHRPLEYAWFRRWFFAAPRAAWQWFKNKLESVELPRDEQLRQFAANFGSLKPEGNFVGDAYAEILFEIYTLLSPIAKPLADIDDFDKDPATAVVGSIPNLLRSAAGAAANSTLAALASAELNPEVRTWLLSLQFDHAASSAQGASIISPSQIRALTEDYEDEPVNERALLNQVLARLSDIRLGMEEGPFSDRRFFKPKMLEKDIQLWLAARLAERNPMRRFTVQREEEVDDDKKTDIQLGTGKGFTICVEIKPAERYSASELVSTLKDQIVGQYLKGKNSANGILVLFRLNPKKRWRVPTHRNLQSFDVLLTYLKTEAERIRDEHNAQPAIRPVESLNIFAIRCFV